MLGMNDKTLFGCPVLGDIPEEAVKDILSAVLNVRYNASLVGINLKHEDILIYPFENEVFVIGNPVVDEKTLYNDAGDPVVIPIRNVHLNWFYGLGETREWKEPPDTLSIHLTIPAPQATVLMPFLIERILWHREV